MGCGRVGSAIARRLEEVGHSVAVIDQDPAAFRRLGAEFGGRQVTGLGFDRQTLLDAGIDTAGAFAAVSSGDNSNIISARVAREPTGKVLLMRITVTEGWVGRKLADLESASGARAAWLVRFGEAQLPTAGSVLQDGDQLVVAVTDEIANRVHEVVEHGHRGG